VGRHQKRGQVGIAPGTEHFGPAHAEAVIFFQYDIEIRDRLVVAGPSSSGVKFGCGFEKVCAAADTLIYAGLFDVIESAGERLLRPFIGGDVILLGRQYMFPLCVRLSNFIDEQHLVLAAIEYLYFVHDFII